MRFILNSNCGMREGVTYKVSVSFWEQPMGQKASKTARRHKVKCDFGGTSAPRAGKLFLQWVG